MTPPEEDLGTATTVPAARAGAETTPEVGPLQFGAELPFDDRLTLPARRRVRLRRLSNVTAILVASAALGVIAGFLLRKVPPPPHRSAARAAPAVSRPSAAVAPEAPLATTPAPAAVTVTDTTASTGNQDEQSARARTTTGRQGRSWHASRRRKASARAAKAPRANHEPARDAAIVCTDAADHGEMMGADLQSFQHRAQFVAIDLENPYP